MKTFTLPTGETVMVDDDDYETVIQRSWSRVVEPSGNVYAITNVNRAGGKRTTMSMHRLLTGANGAARVDHKDGNGLNNQRANFRVGTDRDNLRASQRKRQGCTSRFRGVHWDRSARKWRACVQVRAGEKMLHFYAGRHDSEISAAVAYNERAAQLGFFPEALNKVA